MAIMKAWQASQGSVHFYNLMLKTSGCRRVVNEQVAVIFKAKVAAAIKVW